VDHGGEIGGGDGVHERTLLLACDRLWLSSPKAAHQDGPRPIPPAGPARSVWRSPDPDRAAGGPSSPSPDRTNGLDRSKATCYTVSKAGEACLRGGPQCCTYGPTAPTMTATPSTGTGMPS